MPISLILSKQSYSGKQLRELIKLDALASLSIMIKNNLQYRVLNDFNEIKSFLCLQSFCSEANIDKETQKINHLEAILMGQD